MRRREVLAFLGAFALPLSARAQQTRTPTLGVLIGGVREPFWTVFRAGLRDLGYDEPGNIRIEVRASDGQAERLPGLAAELVRSNVDVIVAVPTPAVAAVKQATSEIPIVMVAGDPIGTGLVASLARPGGNITGVSSAVAEMAGKNVELLKELQPTLARIAVLANAADPFTTRFLDHIRSTAKPAGVAIEEIMIQRADELDRAFSRIARDGAAPVILQPSLPRGVAAELGLKYRVPVVCPNPGFAAAGGLMAYAGDPADTYRKAAVYVDKILKGAKPADLPVEMPTKFRLEVNLKTAAALGLDIPPMILARADEVIE